MRVSAALVVGAVVLGACGGPTRVVDFAAEDEKEHWKEIPVKLPPYPRDENLVQFAVGGGVPHRFYIDAPSLSVGEDGVVRYTLVTRTAGGATNVTFEGTRCDGRRQKYYAVGEAGGVWTPARNPHWRRIQLQDPDRQYRALVDDYLCVAASPRGNRQTILDRLKRGPVDYQYY